jgi:hypothetical protein
VAGAAVLAGIGLGVGILEAQSGSGFEPIIHAVGLAKHLTFTATYRNPAALLTSVTYEQDSSRSLEVVIGRDGVHGVSTLVVGSRVYQCPVPRSRSVCLTSKASSMDQMPVAPAFLLFLFRELDRKGSSVDTFQAHVSGRKGLCARFKSASPGLSGLICVGKSGELLSYRDNDGTDLLLSTLRNVVQPGSFFIPS